MPSKQAVLRNCALAAEALLLWVLQSTPKLFPELLGAKPFFLLAMALSVSACSEAIPAVVWGAVCGTLADLSAGGTIGWFAVSFTLVCFAQSSLLGTYLNRNLLTGAVLSLGAILVVLGLYFVFFRLFAGVPECGTLFVTRYLPRMALTYLSFFPLYALNRFLIRL